VSGVSGVTAPSNVDSDDMIGASGARRRYVGTLLEARSRPGARIAASAL
jgi:hypothetical protein